MKKEGAFISKGSYNIKIKGKVGISIDRNYSSLTHSHVTLAKLLNIPELGVNNSIHHRKIFVRITCAMFSIVPGIVYGSPDPKVANSRNY